MPAATIGRAFLVSLALLLTSAGGTAWLIHREGWAIERGGGGGGRAARIPEAVPSTPRAPPLTCGSPREVRSLRRFCGTARAADLPQLRRLALGSPDPLVSGNAIRALGRLGGIEAAEAEVLLGDPNPRVRQEAAIALGESGDPDAVRILERVLERGDPVLRPLAIRSLGGIGTAEARQAIERAARADGATAVDRAFAAAALRS